MSSYIKFLQDIRAAFEISSFDNLPKLHVRNTDQNLPSWFDVSDLAVATMGFAGVMASRLLSPHCSAVDLDKRLASLWFGTTLRPAGWNLPPMWDAIAGDYQTADGWIRLHTNAPHHRAAAVAVLGGHEDRKSVETAVSKWKKDDLEQAVVDAKGCAAAMMDLEAWAQHSQGKAVAAEPLVDFRKHGETDKVQIMDGTLKGLKVLDLTRVLAGPVATRLLAGFGADILRIDPPTWDEPGVVPEVTLGKRCAGLDLKVKEDRAVFEGLLKQADVLVHGYRPGALEDLGYDRTALEKLTPHLIDVSLTAYGCTGPWSNRRGFDSLVQMSCGIADYGMRMSGAGHPVPLPVQALDHATGYLMAAAVLQCLHRKAATGNIMSARLSLARTAHLLCQSKRNSLHDPMRPETPADCADQIEHTAWGRAKRIKFPLQIEGMPCKWALPASPLRTAQAKWN